MAAMALNLLKAMVLIKRKELQLSKSLKNIGKL
jgi:hypothetical protein